MGHKGESSRPANGRGIAAVAFDARESYHEGAFIACGNIGACKRQLLTMWLECVLLIGDELQLIFVQEEELEKDSGAGADTPRGLTELRERHPVGIVCLPKRANRPQPATFSSHDKVCQSQWAVSVFALDIIPVFPWPLVTVCPHALLFLQLQEEMQQYLDSHDHGAVLVTGMSGVGKTQFVIRALWDLFEKSR